MAGITAAELRSALEGGALVLDLRPPEAFARGHIPGSLNLQFGRHDLAERAEMFVPRTAPVAVVVEPDALGPVAERILGDHGYRVLGHLRGGLRAWSQAGGPLASLPVMQVEELRTALERGSDAIVLDVREPFEYAYGHVPGALNIPHGEIAQRLHELDPTRPVAVVCNDQVRSGAAASILRRAGFQDVTLVLGGVSAWMEAGYQLARVGP